LTVDVQRRIVLQERLDNFNFIFLVEASRSCCSMVKRRKEEERRRKEEGKKERKKKKKERRKAVLHKITRSSHKLSG